MINISLLSINHIKTKNYELFEKKSQTEKRQYI